MATAVIVADMLKCFMEPGHSLYVGDEARRIIPCVQRTIEDELAKGSKVFFIADNHAPDDPEFKMFPPHCVRGSEEAQVIPELSKYPGELVPKTHYSSFFDTALDEKLKELKTDRLIVCGVCTDICVLYTAADARNRGYEVEVPAGCVATFDPEAHEWALKHMEKILGAKVTQRPC